jgi:hypothetical protein
MANRLQLNEYKGNRCAYCGLSVQEMVERYGTANRMFQFHHVDPLTKHPEYDNLIRRTISTEQLDELDKCILLCDQHHALVHEQNIPMTLRLTVDAGEKEASQTLNGLIIFDRKDNVATFLTNEQCLVVPYLVAIGDEEPRLLFGTELVEDKLIAQLIWNLPTTKKLAVVRCSDERSMLVAKHIEGKRVKLERDITFQLLPAELCIDESDKTYVWVRNGLALTRDGDVIHSGILSTELTLSRST